MRTNDNVCSKQLEPKNNDQMESDRGISSSADWTWVTIISSGDRLPEVIQLLHSRCVSRGRHSFCAFSEWLVFRSLGRDGICQRLPSQTNTSP